MRLLIRPPHPAQTRGTTLLPVTTTGCVRTVSGWMQDKCRHGEQPQEITFITHKSALCDKNVVPLFNHHIMPHDDNLKTIPRILLHTSWTTPLPVSPFSFRSHHKCCLSTEPPWLQQQGQSPCPVQVNYATRSIWWLQPRRKKEEPNQATTPSNPYLKWHFKFTYFPQG